MGCVSSKKSVAGSPVVDDSAAKASTNDNATLNCVIPLKNPCGALEIDGKEEEERQEDHHDKGSRELKKSKKGNSQRKTATFGIKLGLSHRHVDVEQIAAGWPAWLTAAAPEAVHGLVPIRADAFEKLDKIGQGTYSSVFRAREVATGKIVALKKVRFDNFQPESIRFMAREIMILRRLDHPNILKLEGVITSRLSSTIYLVFEYMEHDFAGLLNGGIKFTEPQIKCYMKQLLHAVEHCHLRGIMHRDIKTSNILVNNQGTLKLADFGLANMLLMRNKQKLTSRVVTLWYRPPELLMGSTNYNVSVDLWSVGCVFAELIVGKPILKGRTEVEQLHKIFRLCGSPPEDYWGKVKLPHANMFKPQNNYEGCLRVRCKDFPASAVNLMETFLSIDPSMRGTASSALMSEYFFTTPYACDPSELPIYPSKKELDGKHWDERRKKARARLRESAALKRPRRVRPGLQEPISYNKLATKEDLQNDTHVSNRNTANNAPLFKGRGSSAHRDSLNPSTDIASVTSAGEAASLGDSVFTAPPPVSASSGFAWAKRRKDNAKTILSSTSQLSAIDSSNLGFVDSAFGNSIKEANQNQTEPKKSKLYQNSSVSMPLQPKQHRSTVSFDASDVFHSQDYELSVSSKEDRADHRKNLLKGNVKFSEPQLTRSQRIDELLQRNESNILLANRRSRFYRER
ncbi:protein IMPAIRED IN BABA-INDUCED STERILITY 1 isoform X2 [Mangifera indica]|uniref:protein IMPAIRED IN BABA-INDUCED STERILITY 1 isoform X2 n=1 Tax=Mangifera indica TaxID=29780 RepID=UPI001CFA23AF|nr:protein IMPAIRED IN BABA-INDUCED STERILITY 1 isoform X2 [Mangifera indica]